MCLVNLNATVLLCNKILDDESLIGVFDRITPDVVGTKPTISFAMLVSLSAMLPKIGSTMSGDVKYIERDAFYDVKVRIEYAQTGNGFDIDNFSFSTHQFNRINNERDVYELKRFIHLNDFEYVYGCGEYAVKVLVKKNPSDANEKWVVQTVHKFTIN